MQKPLQANGFSDNYWGFDIEVRPSVYDHLPEEVATGLGEHYSANRVNFLKSDCAGDGVNTFEFSKRLNLLY